MDPQWLKWAKKLQALAQNGLTFTNDPFDIERYEALRTIAAEIMAEGSGTDTCKIHNLFSGESGYATPKVDVRGVVLRDNAMLFVKERTDGRWSLPGGWADIGESPHENVEREVYEESGYQTRAVKLLAVYDRSRHPNVPPGPWEIYKLFFLCELTGGTATTSIEIDQVGFFHEDQIPELSLGHVTGEQVARMFEHTRHQDWPTDFD